jgi:hypothetical protein
MTDAERILYLETAVKDLESRVKILEVEAAWGLLYRDGQKDLPYTFDYTKD